MATAAPVIQAEMNHWTSLGGKNSGIVADTRTHSSGFHMSVKQLASLGKRKTDYSITRDPKGANGPFVNDNWACAGDFSHGNDPELRAMHAVLLGRLMSGDLPMIAEFIGKPWPDQPVYYWARWNGITVLKRYTGAGHDHWSHIAWYRSRADEPAGLWTPQSMGGFEAMFVRKGMGSKTKPDEGVRYLQLRLGRVGYPVTVDGIFGNEVETAVKKVNEVFGSKASGAVADSYVWTRLDELLAKKFAGKDGKDGKDGQPGKKGDDGKNGKDGVLILPESITLTARIEPAP